MRTAHLLGLALVLSAFASQASAQGTTQIASTPADHAWWPSAQEHTAPLALHTRDDQRLASWYIDHLGFKLAGVAGPVRGGGSQTRATTVYHGGVVLQLEHAKARAPQTLVVTVRDFSAQLRALEAAGIAVQTQGARSAQLRDPEGNLIQLVDGAPPPALATRSAR
ncbi:MAG TPA: VOC family protein [Polyangiales bacterium]|nr:VOC family protein [Polyangiales bacterium]